MIGPVLMMAFAGAVFVEQDFEGFVNSYSNRGSILLQSYRTGDYDGDGLSDLLLQDSVVFQKNGAFSRVNQHRLPDFGREAIFDTWGQDLYFRLASRLEILQWSDSGWKRVTSQELAWPDDERLNDEDSPPGSEQSAYHSFGVFLHDIDGDGQPEIVVPGPDGIQVFHRNGAFFEPAGLLAVSPPLEIVPPSNSFLWPEHRRAIQAPVQMTDFSFGIEGGRLSVSYSEGMSGQTTRFHLIQYAVRRQGAASFHVEPLSETVSEAVPWGTDAFFLSDVEALDLCRFERSRQSGSAFPVPTLSVSVSTDGGRSFQSLRAVSLAKDAQFVDMNSDGQMDLVMQSTSLFDGGLRETVLRATTRRRVDLKALIHLQADDHSFAETPSLVCTFPIDLDRAPMHQSFMFHDYVLGRLLNLAGDFNGDGYHDAAVQDRPDRIAVYTGSPQGFDDSVYASVPAMPGGTFHVTDFDGDGLSDISVRDPLSEDADQLSSGHLYLLRNSQP